MQFEAFDTPCFSRAELPGQITLGLKERQHQFSSVSLPSQCLLSGLSWLPVKTESESLPKKVYL